MTRENTGSALNIDMAPTGHWHVTTAKVLKFTVTSASGKPVKGLKPAVTVKTTAGTVDKMSATDNGDGSYSTGYTPEDIGSDYAMAYSFSFSFEFEGSKYFEGWPVEIVRDGREDIMPVVNGKRYCYHIRYAWNPGTIFASDEKPVTLYCDLRRAVEEGDEINTGQPWLNAFNPLYGLEVTMLVESVDGAVSETLTPGYVGMGVYRTQRIFSKAEVGKGKDYRVSILFTDPHNGFSIDKTETAYKLVVSAAVSWP